MAFYKTCPSCGSSLDPGERCDCSTEQKQVKHNVAALHQNITHARRSQYIGNCTGTEYRERIAFANAY